MALPSIGTTAIRWLTNRPRTTTSASSSGSGPSRSRRPTAKLEPMASNWTGASGWSAASASITASNGSASTSMASTASAAWAAVSATTATIASPTKRTRSTARGGRAQASLSETPKLWNGARSKSAWVNAATTPGMDTAADTSTEVIVGVGVRRAHEREMEKAGHVQVVDERSAPLEQLRVLHPHDLGSEQRSGHHRHTT